MRTGLIAGERMVKHSWCHRQGEADAGALARRAGCPNAPAMTFDQLLDDRQPQPSPTGGPRARAIRAIKSIKHIRQVLGRDARAAIADRDKEAGRLGAKEIGTIALCLAA